MAWGHRLKRLTKRERDLCRSMGWGCAGCRQNCEFVEMALRTRESELRETREELHRSRMVNEALLQELGSIRQAAPCAGTAVRKPARSNGCSLPQRMRTGPLSRLCTIC